MFRFLKELLWPPPKPPVLRRVIDFTHPREDHWASFDGGNNFDARFTIRGNVAFGDQILVAMQSGRIGCYRLFSVRSDFTGKANWKAQGMAVAYWTEAESIQRVVKPALPKVKGLLGNGSGWIRSDSGQLAHLPSGFTKPASEFWKVLCRDEACNRRSNSMRANG